MDVRHLEAFLAVAEESHFGRAAERLHLAQPPLSRTIKQLEQELGARLFDRTTRRVRLTAAGTALVAPARTALEALGIARRAVHAAGRGETGQVRIGFAGPSSHLMVGRLGRMIRERHPGIELTLRNTTYSYEGLRLVVDGDLDLAIVRWSVAPRGIAHRIVGEEHYVLVVPADHRLAGRRVVSMAECSEEDFVALPSDPGASVRDALLRFTQSAGYTPRIVQSAPDTWTSLALVAAGVGITLTLDTAVANVQQRGICTVRLREGRTPTYSYLAWREGDPNPALHAVLRAAEETLPTPTR